ncbi:MAG: response regulator transcription factor, partial [Proteobacteria bacterium]|nr:response regulator transcription factor [Pseudomonadota bacterium]
MRIALIEDNEALAKGIAYQLRDAGHAVDLIGDGVAADTFLSQEGADLIVLDINLPGMDGLTILQRIRGRGDATPVILLTARSDTGDRVKGLDAGADDYLVKPFEMAELEARVRALSRRRPAVATTRVPLGSLEFDTQSRQLFDAGQSLEIPRREIAVLECLLDKRGRLVPKESILDR